MVHTFLSAGQIDELVALYVQGMTLPELGERFGVHHRTAAAHLVRRSVPQVYCGERVCITAVKANLSSGETCR